MNKERYELRKAQFLKALKRLGDALVLPENEVVRDATIQRFEFTYELAWKTMKMWLECKDIDVRNAKDTLQEALVQGLIADGNAWTELHQMRNLTSHTYDEATAKKIYDFLKQEGFELFQKFRNKLETL